jgi:hypothetical protein
MPRPLPHAARLTINIVLFQLCWFAAVIGAGLGHGWIGVAALPLALLPHLALVPRPARQAALILELALAGLVIDSLLGAAGLMTYATTPWPPWIAPPWLIALWALFASTLSVSFFWMRAHPRWAAFFGLIGGPLSYYAGARLGALDLHQSVWPSLLALAIVWAALMPLLARRSARFD